MKSGNLNFLETSGPLSACNGTALPLLLYQLFGLFGFVGNGIVVVNRQVNPEFAAEVLVLLLGVHEGLQYQKSSKKRLSSLSFFFTTFLSHTNNNDMK